MDRNLGAGAVAADVAHDHMDPTRLGPPFWQESTVYSVVYSCDLCSLTPEVGQRHHCCACQDFDLCDQCYRSIQEGQLRQVAPVACVAGGENTPGKEAVPAASLLAAATSAGTRRALIVAVEEYDDKEIRNLANVDFDANLLKTTLQKLGWEVEMLFGPGLEKARAEVDRFAESVAGSGEACLLAFVGHGVEAGGHIFLVPRDA
ncbi:hypothetical protein T484DRAFT_1920103, partial [Baffinella frigidus]